MKHELTKEERRQRLDRAELTVKRYAYGSALVGALPIPLIDLALLTAVQLKMVAALAEIFETEFRGCIAKGLISSLVGLAAASAVATPLASTIKVLPGIGSIAGVLTVGGLGSATTYAVGRVFIAHFAAGGTILTLDPEKVRDFYVKQLESSQDTLQFKERRMP